jgi:hypothetical protein
MIITELVSIDNFNDINIEPSWWDQLLEAEQLFLSALDRERNFELAQAGLCQVYLE